MYASPSQDFEAGPNGDLIYGYLRDSALRVSGPMAVPLEPPNLGRVPLSLPAIQSSEEV